MVLILIVADLGLVLSYLNFMLFVIKEKALAARLLTRSMALNKGRMEVVKVLPH